MEKIKEWLKGFLKGAFEDTLFELLPYMEINEHFLRRMLFKEERLPVLFSRFEGWA